MRFHLFIYSFIITLFISFPEIHSQDICSKIDVSISKDRIFKKIAASKLATATKEVDSILQAYNKQIKCPQIQEVLHYKARIYELKHEFEKSLEICNQVLEQAIINKDVYLQAFTYLTVSRVHDFLKREIDLRRNLDHARNLIFTYNIYAHEAEYYVREASYQRFFGQIDSVTYYSELAIESGKKYNSLWSLADAYFLRGSYENNFSISIFYLKKAFDVHKLYQNHESCVFQLVNIAQKYQKINELIESNAYLDSANIYLNSFTEKTPDYHYVSKIILEKKSENYRLMGNMDSSIYFLQLALDKHSSTKETNQSKITQIETEFALKAQQLNLQNQKQKTLYSQIGFLISLLLLGLISLLYFRNLKSKALIEAQRDIIAEKSAELAKSLDVQSTLLSEVHHRVKNNLQVVISLLSLKSSKLESQNIMVGEHFEDISTKVRSIALIHENLYKSSQFDTININDYVNTLTDQFQKLISTSQKVFFNIEIDELINLNVETSMPIGIILSELISNSFKYASEPAETLIIDISIKRLSGSITLSYADNGKGFDPKHIKEGLGFILLRSMVRQLKGESFQDSANGFSFKLIFNEKTVSNISIQ